MPDSSKAIGTEPEGVLPVNASVDGVRGLAIGESFREMELGHHRELGEALGRR